MRLPISFSLACCLDGLHNEMRYEYPFRMSSALRCPRSQYYEIIGAEKTDRSMKSKIRTFVGNVVDKGLKDASLIAPFDGWKKLDFEDTLKLTIPIDKKLLRKIRKKMPEAAWLDKNGVIYHGHQDLVLIDTETGRIAVIDFKTSEYWSSSNAKRGKVSREYLAQILMYDKAFTDLGYTVAQEEFVFLDLSGALYEVVIKGDKSLIGYHLTDQFDIKSGADPSSSCLVIPGQNENHPTIDDVRTVATTAISGVLDGIPPEKPYTMHPFSLKKGGEISKNFSKLEFPCKFCDFREHCWGKTFTHKKDVLVEHLPKEG